VTFTLTPVWRGTTPREYCTSFQDVLVEDEPITAGVPGALVLTVAVAIGQGGPSGGEHHGADHPGQSLPQCHPLEALPEAGGELLAWEWKSRTRLC